MRLLIQWAETRLLPPDSASLSQRSARIREDISIPSESILIRECMRYENLILKKLPTERDSVRGRGGGGVHERRPRGGGGKCQMVTFVISSSQI
jgi:hypothetical protein